MFSSVKVCGSCRFQWCSATLPNTHRARNAPLHLAALLLQLSQRSKHSHSPGKEMQFCLCWTETVSVNKETRTTARWPIPFLKYQSAFFFLLTLLINLKITEANSFRILKFTGKHFYRQTPINYKLVNETYLLIRLKHKPTFSKDHYISLLIWYFCYWDSPEFLNYLLVCVHTNM